MGQTAALVACCYHNSPEFLASLVKMGSSVDALDNIGWGALHHAAMGNCASIINVLVDKYGLMPDKTSYEGKTTAHVAVSSNSLEAFKALFPMIGPMPDAVDVWFWPDPN